MQSRPCTSADSAGYGMIMLCDGTAKKPSEHKRAAQAVHLQQALRSMLHAALVRTLHR